MSHSRSVPQASTVLSEHRSLFGSRNLSSVSQGHTSRRSSARSRTHPYHRSLPTHTHTFVCLAKKNTNDVPKAAEKQSLYCSGLGEHRIQFVQADDAASVKQKLLKEYPPLRGCNGFTLMQCSSGNRLAKIPEPPEGYSAKYIMTLGSSRVYIRPLCDIDISRGSSTQSGIECHVSL